MSDVDEDVLDDVWPIGDDFDDVLELIAEHGGSFEVMTGGPVVQETGTRKWRWRCKITVGQVTSVRFAMQAEEAVCDALQNWR